MTITDEDTNVVLEATTELGYRRGFHGLKLRRSEGFWDGQRFVPEDELEWDELPTGRGQ